MYMYGDPVYKLKSLKGEAILFPSGWNIVKHLRRRKYDPVIIEGTLGLVFGPSTAFVYILPRLLHSD